MAIIMGEAPKVDRKGTDAKVIRTEEQWDLLHENTQPQMLTVGGLVKVSPTDPIKGTGGTSFSMEETSFDMSSLVSPSTMDEQSMNSSLLVNNENNLPSGINDICSDLNTPDISDLHGFVFPSGNKDAVPSIENSLWAQTNKESAPSFLEQFPYCLSGAVPSIENSLWAQTKRESASPGFIGQDFPYSPEFLNQGCLKVSDENPPEEIVDPLSDEKNPFKDEISEDYILDQLVTNDLSPVHTSESSLYNSNSNYNSNYKENRNETLTTINYENLFGKDLFTQAIKTQSNEISDKEREEMVNSFLNNEETTSSSNLNSDDTTKSILNSFLKEHGEPAIFISKVKYITQKKANSVFRIQTKPTVQNSLNHSSMVQNSLDHSSMVQNSLNHSSMVQNSLDHSSMVQNSLNHSSMVQNSLNHSSIVQNSLDHSSMVQNSLDHSSMVQNSLDHSSMVQNSLDHSSMVQNSLDHSSMVQNASPQLSAAQNTSPHKEQIIVTIRDQNTFVQNDYLNMHSATTRINVKSSEPFPSTSAIAIPVLVKREGGKRKTKPPLKYEDEMISDYDDDDSLHSSPSNYRAKKKSKFSLEGLSDAEKYQRIRQQNNVASKKCRDKKKLQQLSHVEELQSLESHHAHLTAENQVLERRKHHWENIVNSFNLDYFLIN